MGDLFNGIWTLFGWLGFIGGAVGIFLANEGRLDENCFPNCDAYWLLGVAGVGVGLVVNQVLRRLDIL